MVFNDFLPAAFFAKLLMGKSSRSALSLVGCIRNIKIHFHSQISGNLFKSIQLVKIKAQIFSQCITDVLVLRVMELLLEAVYLDSTDIG